jgi:hypothetical protein
MAKYVLIHGGLKVGSGPDAKHAEVLDRIDLDPKVARAMDPDGRKLLTEEEWAVAMKEAAIRIELEEKRRALGDVRPVPPTLEAAIQLEMARQKRTPAKPEAKK